MGHFFRTRNRYYSIRERCYSNSHDDVPKVAQWNVSIVAPGNEVCPFCIMKKMGSTFYIICPSLLGPLTFPALVASRFEKPLQFLTTMHIP